MVFHKYLYFQRKYADDKTFKDLRAVHILNRVLLESFPNLLDFLALRLRLRFIDNANLTLKAPPIICSRRQFQILLFFQK